jgi:hypothetical protein
MKRIIAANGYQVTNDDTKPGDIKQYYPNLVHGHSQPANGEYYPIYGVHGQLSLREYDIKTILLTRDWMAMSKSQVRQGRVPDLQTAYDNIRTAYEMIFDTAEDDFIVVSYESLIRYPRKTLDYIGEFLGQHLEMPEEIYDGNQKYFT